ncbi:MAG: 2-C-methyl-D-erythritol 4-phosphate cytidylyltransferase [Corynebacterium matruchotii]
MNGRAGATTMRRPGPPECWRWSCADGRAEDESLAASDDAALVEACGGSVVVVAGDERAMKVTTPMDLALAELLLAQ